jgi:hypothetical protein
MIKLLLIVGWASLLQAQPTPSPSVSATATPRLGPPQPIYSPYPEYESDWAKKGLQGKCIVRLSIDPSTGTTTGVRIIKSTGNNELDGADWQSMCDLLTRICDASKAAQLATTP